jgi:hypothetical protein
MYLLANPPLNPTLLEQVDHPLICYWLKLDFRTEFNVRKKKGETDGQASSIRTKRKAGRPPKSSTEDPDNHSAHFYLEYHNGTPVSREDIAELSQFARGTWEDLNNAKLVPSTFGKMSRLAWDYFWHSIVAIPTFSFLLLCEGGQWKLRHWSTQSYSSWAANRGVRPAKLKTEMLDDAKLIRMGSDSDLDNNKDSKGKCPQKLTDSNDNNHRDMEDPWPNLEENNDIPLSDLTLVCLYSSVFLTRVHPLLYSPHAHLQPMRQ